MAPNKNAYLIYVFEGNANQDRDKISIAVRAELFHPFHCDFIPEYEIPGGNVDGLISLYNRDKKSVLSFINYERYDPYDIMRHACRDKDVIRCDGRNDAAEKVDSSFSLATILDIINNVMIWKRLLCYENDEVVKVRYS